MFKINLKEELFKNCNNEGFFINPTIEVDLESEAYKVYMEQLTYGESVSDEVIKQDLAHSLAMTIAKKFESSLQLYVKESLHKRTTSYALQANIVLPDERAMLEAKEEAFIKMIKATYGELGATKDKLTRTSRELDELKNKTLWQKLVWSIKNC